MMFSLQRENFSLSNKIDFGRKFDVHGKFFGSEGDFYAKFNVAMVSRAHEESSTFD